MCAPVGAGKERHTNIQRGREEERENNNKIHFVSFFNYLVEGKYYNVKFSFLIFFYIIRSFNFFFFFIFK